MSLIRTVSSTNNPNDMSYCADGESETITLTQSSTDPTGPAVLAISGTDPVDYGNVSVGGNSSLGFTVSNSGGETASAISASGLSAPFDFTGGSYPGTGGDCGLTLAAGASCTVYVTFSPSSTGIFADSLDIDYNDSAASQSAARSISGTGVSASLANLTISDGPVYDYGTNVTGSSTNRSFTVSNSGSGVATSMSGSGLAAPYSFSGGAYPGTGGTCGATLAGGANCVIVVSFQPTISGVANDTIDLNYNDGASASVASRNITGTGAIPALLTISESDPFDFGGVQVGFSNTHIFTVTNTGGAVATSIFESGLAAPFMFSGGAYPGVGGTCTSIITPGSNCTLDIVFSPAALGVSADTIDVGYNDGAAFQSATRDVQGTGTP